MIDPLGGEKSHTTTLCIFSLSPPNLSPQILYRRSKEAAEHLLLSLELNPKPTAQLLYDLSRALAESGNKWEALKVYLLSIQNSMKNLMRKDMSLKRFPLLISLREIETYARFHASHFHTSLVSNLPGFFFFTTPLPFFFPTHPFFSSACTICTEVAAAEYRYFPTNPGSRGLKAKQLLHKYQLPSSSS